MTRHPGCHIVSLPSVRPPSGAEVEPIRVLRLLAALAGALGALGCDDAFAPIEPSPLAFSIFGHLDAAADTQWIRITPLRPVLLTTPEPLDLTVTVEEEGAGRPVELRDSVFHFTEHHAGVGSEGVYLHNFWTVTPIEPGGTYRFLVEDDRGARAEAVVKVPPEYSVEAWYGQTSGTRNHLRLAGVQHAATVAITHFYDGCGPDVWRHALKSASTESDTLTLPIEAITPRRESCGSTRVEKREILVIGSGSEWPEGTGYSTSALGTPSGPSNVSNALGYLGGVLTRLVPQEICEIEQVRSLDPKPYCALRYDASTVTLTGTVTDVVCGGPISGAVVRLRELEPDPVEGRKLRLAPTTRAGGYEISALEGGQPYQLTVRRTDALGFDLYQEYADTLQFAAGETARYDVGLSPLSGCQGG